MKLKTKYFLLLFIFFLPIYLLRLNNSLSFGFQEGDMVRIVSQLSQEPALRAGKQVFKLEGVLVSYFGEERLVYGDWLEVKGVVGKEGRWERRLDQVEIRKIDLWKNGIRVGLVNGLFKLKDRLVLVFKRTLTEPEASLLAGIVLGVKSNLSSDFYQALQNSGTLHLVVASGMNISLTAGALAHFLSKFLGRKLGLIVSLVCILIYCLIAGMNPPIVRAGLMAGVLYLSIFLGRETSGFWTLLLVGAVMLLIKPLLLFDIGFHLSFMATAGLISLSPIFSSLFKRVGWLRVINKEGGETLGAIVFTAPILIISFNNFNPFSLIPNLLVLWLIEYLMVLGLIIGLVGLVWLGLGQVLAWIAWVALRYMVEVINFFGQIEFLNLKMEGFSWIFGLAYYLILFFWLNRRGRKRRIYE